CLKEVDQQLLKCIEYLRENKGCTLQQLSEATGVPTRTIIRFIRDGRIATMSSPNLATPCEHCGEPAIGSNLCDPCRRKLSQDIQQMKSQAQQKKTNMESSGEWGNTYIKDRFKTDRH